jgi:hypothetical protein
MGTSTATGAATGAAAGAIAGSIVPIVGNAAGAVVGALSGGAIGFFNGIRQDGKFKKQAREAARNFVNGYVDSMQEALKMNDVSQARKLFQGFGDAAQKMADGQVKSGTALKEANKKFYEENKNTINSTLTMIARFKDLERITGLTEKGVQDLANTAEVDLGNSMMTLQQILAATGVATARFGDDFKYAMTDIYASATSSFRQTLELVQAPDIYAAAGRAFGQKGRANTVTDEDRAAFFEDIFQQSLLMAGNDPVKAFINMQREYGTAARPGGQFSVMQGGKKGDLYGLADVFFGGGGAAMWSGGMGELAGGAAGLTAENLISEAARLGIDLGMGKDQLTRALTTMSTTNPTQFASILEATSNGTFLTPEIMGYAGRGGAITGGSIQEQLGKLLGDELADKFKIQETASKTLKDASTGFKGGSDAFGEAVSKFATAVDVFSGGGGDTATPRQYDECP